MSLILVSGQNGVPSVQEDRSQSFLMELPFSQHMQAKENTKTCLLGSLIYTTERTTKVLRLPPCLSPPLNPQCGRKQNIITVFGPPQNGLLRMVHSYSGGGCLLLLGPVVSSVCSILVSKETKCFTIQASRKHSYSVLRSGKNRRYHGG